MEKLYKELFRITSYVADQAGCANIRVIIPFILLNQLQIPKFQFQAYYNNFFTKDVGYYRNSTIIQFQRAATQHHLEFFNLIRKKIKILTRSALVYEIDDDVFNIPSWNFAREFYIPLKPFITEMLNKADAITVSTEKLKQLYSPYNNNIHIIPNYLPRFTWRYPVFNTKETKRPKIAYPCSSNHFSIKRDIVGGDIGPVLLDFIRKTVDDYEWMFIGGMPIELDDLVKSGKIVRHPWHSIYEYPRYFQKLEAHIGIAPLEINEFNRGKSGIKALEFTASGLPGVFTKIDPYDTMILQANNEQEFIGHIESLRDIDKRHKVWQSTYDMLKDDLYWEDNGYKNLKKFVKTYLNMVKKDVNF
jgi:hypothetical protein